MTWSPALELDGRLRAYDLRLGKASIRYTGGQTTSSLSHRPRTEFTLHWPDHEPVDYLAPLEMKRLAEAPDGFPSEQPLFSGVVDEVTVEAETLRILGLGAHELAERTTGLLLTGNLPAQQIVHMLARSAGMPEERLQIQGIDEAALEVIQVCMPVDGLDAQDASVGQVRLCTDPGMAASFAQAGHSDAPVYAVTYVAKRLLFDAEQAGIAAIEAALDRLAVAALYGLSTRPGGRPLPYSRRRARARPRPRRVVHVMGVSSGRRWCRHLDAEGTEAAASAVELLNEWPELAVEGATSTARALAALRRAADPAVARVERVQALWNAIEFYAAGTSTPKLLDKASKGRLMQAVAAAGLTPDQAERVGEVLAQAVNNAPLSVRLHERARLDGVPLRPQEVELLVELRAQRNDASHGRQVHETDEQRLAWAVSIVARLLLFRHVHEVG